MSKETETPRYLSLVVPLKKVGDEAVHKELGNRMERAATTASSLEAEQDSGSGPMCQDTILGGCGAQTRFETTSKQFKLGKIPPLSKGYTLRSGEDNMKLLELMELYTQLSNMLHKNRKSDLATAKAKTVNGERQIQALIDKKKVIILEMSIRSDLHLEDAGDLKRNSLGGNKGRTLQLLKRRHNKITVFLHLLMIHLSVVLDLEKAKDAQAKEIVDLKKRVQKLERNKKSRTTRLKRLRKVGMARRVESSEDKDSLGDHEDATKQGRSIEDIDKDDDVSFVDDTQGRLDDVEMFDTNDLHDDELDVDMPVGEKQEQSAKEREHEVPLKRKDHVALDEDLARNLQAQLEAELIKEERLASSEAYKPEENKDEINIEERSRMFVELMNQRRKIHYGNAMSEERGKEESL
ncbi:hypothetical protein Tco_1002718 [Tanacetum coccineum]|uniref:Uncharacterized protein n=1 Tax=Tanacetum coccineum TaxID=301880 RepID=A0ABQ5F792_9ASTR